MFIRGYSQNTTVHWAMAQQNPKQGVPIRPIAIGKGHKTNNDGSSGQKRCAKQMSRATTFGHESMIFGGDSLNSNVWMYPPIAGKSSWKQRRRSSASL